MSSQSVLQTEQVRHFVPKLTAWYMALSPLVIRSNIYDSVRLAIQIKSSALAVGAKIISYTVKAAVITEQEPLGQPANTQG